ncbi:hypothetical protein LGN24_00820 [Burkholderia seminalis]|uniref:hypothetical protein n=1 Tax=Burkholderia seminalis TaxID=488731 RepID=UPI001CF32F1E|nr:hypothetical protein [Burkholderia seminalis]
MKLGLNESLARLDDEGTLFTTLFRHGTRDVELYRPRVEDGQTPHTRDEIDVIATGPARRASSSTDANAASRPATRCSSPPTRRIASSASPTTSRPGCSSTARKAASAHATHDAAHGAFRSIA